MRYLIIGLLIILSIENVGAQDPISSEQIFDTTPVVMANLIETAVYHNPDVLAARSNWEQAIEHYPLETALDDPMINFSYYIENVETRVGAQQFSVGIQQRFPFPGTLRQKGRVVEKDIEIAELKYHRILRNVITDLKQAVYELQYINGAIDITQHNQALLNDILLFAQTRYNDMQSGFNEVMRAEAQLAQLEYDLVTLRELQWVQWSEINALLNRPKDEVIAPVIAPIPNPATFSIQALDDLALAQSQELQMAELGVLKAGEQIELAQKLNLPSLNLGANYINTDDAMNPMTPDSGKDPIIVSAGISIPLWFKKNKARVRIAEEMREAAIHENDSVANTIQVNLRKAYFRMQNAMRLMELYENHLIPQAKHSIQIAKEWNQDGMGSVAEILEVQSVWLNFNLAFLRARIDYAQSYVQLERLAGGSLASLITEREQREN